MSELTVVYVCVYVLWWSRRALWVSVGSFTGPVVPWGLQSCRLSGLLQHTSWKSLRWEARRAVPLLKAATRVVVTCLGAGRREMAS